MRWEYNTIPQDLIEIKASEWRVSRFLATLLLKKGFLDEKEVNNFINPSIDKLLDPFKFEMMDQVVNKIIECKNKHEKIYVYGDYDVDGITAAVFLVLTLRRIGCDINYYIPNRMDEGYGLNKSTIDIMKEENTKLIITVDTGVNTLEDVDYARSLGMDIIVTDHHKSVKDKEDEGLLIINPKFSENYEFKHLSGAGVALKVAQAVYKKSRESMHKLYQYIDIVMIGTVADVVPMIGENRIIICEGLKTLKKTKVKGLIYLLKYLKLHDRDISTTDISYFVSPLINSLGRLGNSKLGADFFMETDDFKIYNIIEEMKKTNRLRREFERAIYDEASEKIKLKVEKNKNDLRYVFEASQKWHPGVIGVVASRLSSKYHLPVAMISLKDGLAKASCRSVPGVNIFNIIKDAEDNIIRFGGHDLAAGFIADETELGNIEQYFEKRIDAIEDKETMIQSLEIDMYLPIDKVNKGKMNDLKRLSPFGLSNKHPFFCDEKIKIVEKKFFGVDGRHFSGKLLKDKKTYSLVGFDLSSKLKGDEDIYYDIVYYPEKIIFKGDEYYQFRLKDLKQHSV